MLHACSRYTSTTLRATRPPRSTLPRALGPKGRATATHASRDHRSARLPPCTVHLHQVCAFARVSGVVLCPSIRLGGTVCSALHPSAPSVPLGSAPLSCAVSFAFFFGCCCCFGDVDPASSCSPSRRCQGKRSLISASAAISSSSRGSIRSRHASARVSIAATASGLASEGKLGS